MKYKSIIKIKYRSSLPFWVQNFSKSFMIQIDESWSLRGHRSAACRGRRWPWTTKLTGRWNITAPFFSINNYVTAIIIVCSISSRLFHQVKGQRTWCVLNCLHDNDRSSWFVAVRGVLLSLVFLLFFFLPAEPEEEKLGEKWGVCFWTLVLSRETNQATRKQTIMRENRNVHF